MHTLSHVRLFEALWTVAGLASLPVGARQKCEVVRYFLLRGSSQLRDLPHILYLHSDSLPLAPPGFPRVGFSSWIVIKNIPTFLSTICLPASKHFSSYLLMVKPRVQCGIDADLHFSTQSKPKSCFAGKRNVTLLSAADGQNCSIAQCSQLLIPKIWIF